MHKMLAQSLGRQDPLEKEMAIHSSTLAWEIPQTEEPGRLKSHGVAKEFDMTYRLNNNNIIHNTILLWQNVF